MKSQLTKKLVFAASLILITCGDECFAKDWNGIFPLYSTKTDVLKLSGIKESVARSCVVPYPETPTIEVTRNDGPITYLYRFNESTLAVTYSTTLCDGGYNVPEGRVLEIQVLTEPQPKWVDLLVPNRQTLKAQGSPSDSSVEFSDDEEGISYVVKDGLVESMTYYPSAADDFLRCPKE